MIESKGLPPVAPRLLLIDDEPELLEVLYEWFSCFGYEMRTAKDGIEAIALARRQAFDVIITDLKMPGLSGLHLLAIFKELDPHVQVIFLSGQGTMEDAIEALREGNAFDFLQKPLKNLRGLNAVVERALARRRQLQQAPKPPVRHATAQAIEPLTPREQEILRLLAGGLDNRAIADGLVVSEKTIKNHLSRIYEKLKVKNRTQAVLLCQQYGLFELYDAGQD